MELDRKRWLVIAAGVAANLCSGAAYSFSVFRGAFQARLGCSEPQVALAFSLSLAFLPVGMILAGRQADRGRPRPVVAFGGLVFGLGMFLAGSSHSLIWLYATFGMMMSLGNGAVYGAIVASAVKWFPDRRGMASGMVVGALGLGTLLIAPLAQHMIASPSLGLLGACRMLGTAFWVITLGASLLIITPPAGYVPSGFNAASTESDAKSQDLDWRGMLRMPRFWLLYVIYVAGAFPGLMLISQASPIAQDVTRLSAATAALVVSVLGLANATGRLFWGALSDRIGRFEALMLMFAVTSVVMFAFVRLANASAGLVVATLAVGLCYGGYLGTFPSLCADSFGSRYLSVNYGLLFSAFAVAGILGPRVGALLKESTGGYAEGFIVAGGIAAFGLLVAMAGRIAMRRQNS